MRICSIQKIPQKAKLAKPVYDHKGILLLNKGIDITESIKNKFKANNIYFIYIEEIFIFFTINYFSKALFFTKK